MAQPGTDYFTPVNSTVKSALTDDSGNSVLISCTVANLPSAVAGYVIGCLAIATDSGVLYCNTGTAASASFVKVSST